jgi:hypothetical protein
MPSSPMIFFAIRSAAREKLRGQCADEISHRD